MRIIITPSGTSIPVYCPSCGIVGAAEKPSSAISMKNRHWEEKHADYVFEIDDTSTI